MFKTEMAKPSPLGRLHQHDGVLFEGDWLPLVGVPVFKAKAILKDVWGIPFLADAFVDGCRASVFHVLRQGDRLEFVQRFGFKASDDLASEAGMAEALLRSEPDLTRLVNEVAALPLPAEQRLSIMAWRVVRWMENEFGPPTADAVAMLHNLSHRLHDLAGKQKRLAGKNTEATPARRTARSPNVRVDEGAGEVVVDGTHYSLEPQYLAILTCLMAAGGGCVSRAEMQTRSCRLRDEDRIDRLIARLKKDNKKVGDLIESVPGKGYRLSGKQ